MNGKRASPVAAAQAAPPPCTHCGLPVPPSRRRPPGRDEHPPSPPAAFCCYGCRIAHLLTTGSPDAPGPLSPGNTLLLRLGLGVFLAMNIMAFSSLFYAQEWYGPGDAAASTPLVGLVSYLLLLLCTGVVAALGAPLLMDAIERTAANGRRSIADANLLIFVGVAAAYGLSAWHTVRGRGRLYYDTAAMVLVFVTLGQYLDSAAKRRAHLSAAALLDDLPRRASVARDGRVVEVGLDEVTAGDRVRLRPGECCPVDGPVVEGRAHVNEATLTGESTPRPVAPGDRVMAGSVNLDGLLWVEAQHVGRGRVIDQMKQLLERARLKQPPLQRSVDRVAAVFTPAVVLIAAAVFAHRAWRGEAVTGVFDGLSVMLISCPCALGLAVPLATWNALTRAQRHGVMIDSAQTLERASRVRAVLFDKTGTLTEPRMTVTGVTTRPGTDERRVAAIAAAIESGSAHPVAAALTDHARSLGIHPARATELRVLPGVGLEANVGDQRYRIGNASILPAGPPPGEAPTDPQRQDAGQTVYLVGPSGLLATFSLDEKLRPDAPDAIARLKCMGAHVEVLTGDGPAPARRVAQTLDVPVTPALLPADKMDQLEQVRRQHGPVAMVGDGVNDGPVLAGADVGIAVADATDLANQAGNVRLMNNKLTNIALVLEIARHTMRRVRLNLAWAFGYNLVGIALAAMGYLTPLFAASAMIASSLLIVTTSAGAGRIADAP